MRPTVKSLDKRIKKINREVELKYLDQNVNASIVSTGTLINAFGLVPTGDEASEREGNEITPTSVVARLHVVPDPRNLLTDSNDVVRMIIFWDAQPNGAVPVLVGAAGLLDTSVVTTPFSAPRNINTRKRYKILYDNTVNLNPAVFMSTDTLLNNKMFIVKVKLHRTIKYNGAAAPTTIANVISNSINIAFFNRTSTVVCAVDGSVRMYYKDT